MTMPGSRSVTCWLLSVALFSLCSLTSWGDELEVPDVDLPPGWYLIHETELTALEENSETIGQQTIILRTMFATLLETVNEWQTKSIERQTRTEISLTESENAVVAVEAQTKAIRTELWVYRIGGSALALLSLYLAVRVVLAPP